MNSGISMPCSTFFSATWIFCTSLNWVSAPEIWISKISICMNHAFQWVNNTFSTLMSWTSIDLIGLEDSSTQTEKQKNSCFCFCQVEFKNHIVISKALKTFRKIYEGFLSILRIATATKWEQSYFRRHIYDDCDGKICTMINSKST